MKNNNRMLLGMILVCMILGGLVIGRGVISVEPADEHDAGYQKAMGHLSVIAKEVHPSQTPEIEQVRQYIRDELNRMGCNYVEESFDFEGKHSKNNDPNKDLTNFIVTLDVPESNEAVMLVSHYDSTAGGPGAADDGISVASMLVALEQSMNAYQAGTLKNDMYYLFTDGEEQRMLGAEHFVKNHKDMRQNIKLVANFEARGNEGALIMFQTSANNNKLLGELKRAVSHLDAFSVAARIYEMMPNDTDLTLFLNNGYTSCLNFAMIDGGDTYHQMSDNFENISRDSAYRYYETITEIADYFGNSDLNDFIDDENGVYFPTIGGSIFLLSASCAKTIVTILSVMALVWFVILIIKKQINGKEMLKSAVFFAGSLAASALLSTGYRSAVRALVGNGETTTDFDRFIGYVSIVQAVLVCLLVTSLTVWVSKSLKSYQEQLILAMMICAIAGMALMMWFDCLIYLFMMPLAILLAQSVFVYFLQRSGKTGSVVCWISAIAMIVVMSVSLYPLMKVIYDALRNAFLLYFALVEALGAYLVNVCFVGTMVRKK
ncbi:MAG: M28 family peptidase [bacterium]|nr:M28 family peptidase [bacterium]